MPDRTLHTPDAPPSRQRDDASPAHPSVVSTGPPEPDADPVAQPVATEELRALASPTLAALYASQGHGEMAAAIYAQLVQRGSCRGGRSPGFREPSRLAAEVIIEKLLALRQAARRRRGGPGGEAARRETEEPADGR
jgi:hypothetical protein